MNVCVHNSTQFFWFCSNTVYHKSLFITCTLPDVSFQSVPPALSAETQVMRLSKCLDGLKFISSLEGASPERHPNPTPVWILQASLSSPGASCMAPPPASAPGISTLPCEPLVLSRVTVSDDGSFRAVVPIK